MFNFSFRKKVLFSQLILFVVLILVSIPVMHQTIDSIVKRSLKENANRLIAVLKTMDSQDEMVKFLKGQDLYLFNRVSLLDDSGNLIYDGSLEKVLKEKYVPLHPTENPEVVAALRTGEGYAEEESDIFHQKFAYVAKTFEVQGKTYILRMAFPFSLIEDFSTYFEVDFLSFVIILLLFFCILTWLIFYRLTRPIQQIINAIKNSGGTQQEPIPEIQLDRSLKKEDEFSRLATTLNALSARIRLQVKHALDERNEKEAILESLGEGVIAVDQKMVVTYVNFIGSKMLGIPKRHLMGRPFPSLPNTPTGPLLDRCRHILKACQESMTVMTDSISMGEMRKIYLDLIAAPKTQGNGSIIVLQDKSSQYKVLEMGKDFVANASHELRTPITIIKGFAETLHDLPELSPEMLVDITEKIVRNCERMEMLVKNLLTLADIENLPLTRYRECDIVGLVEISRHHLLSVYGDAHVVINKNKETIPVPADPDLLELAIINLMNNAAKYSNPPAQITVDIEQRADEVKIVIGDKGIGIPASDIEHVFERFYTVNKAHSRRLGGAGLGLSIVKTIIEKHDGTISVSSVLGQGSKFTIILPSFRQMDEDNQ